MWEGWIDSISFVLQSTIPIAKRRYYGRVQQAVHDFLLMGPDVVKGEPQAASIQFFFDPQGVVVVPAKKKDINGQCTKKDGDCRGKEIRDSRFNDMVSLAQRKLSMSFLFLSIISNLLSTSEFDS